MYTYDPFPCVVSVSVLPLGLCVFPHTSTFIGAGSESVTTAPESVGL